MKPEYRKLVTRRGVYFVAWRPEDVMQLFINEKLAPTDLLTAETHENHHLIRDLYLLACAGSLACRHHKCMNLLTQYARELHSTVSVRH